MIRRPPRSTRTDTLFPTRRASDLRVTALGTGLNFGVPISEYDRIFAGVSFEHNEISDFKESAPKAYEDFVDEYGEKTNRSEEHTSELQSLMRISYAVFCLKKKTIITIHYSTKTNTSNINP